MILLCFNETVIPADIKSKSIKQAKEEISEILSKLESKEIDLEASKDYERLIKLNKHIDTLFKLNLKRVNSLPKK